MEIQHTIHDRIPRAPIRDTPQEIIEKFKDFCTQSGGDFTKTYNDETGEYELTCEFDKNTHIEYLVNIMSRSNNTHLMLRKTDTGRDKYMFLDVGHAILSTSTAHNISENFKRGRDFHAVTKGHVSTKKITLIVPPHYSRNPVRVVFSPNENE